MKTPVSRIAAAFALAALFPFALPTFADVIINDRAGDPPGASQHTPSVCLTHRFLTGDHFVAVWNEEVTFASGLPRFNYAVSAVQPLQFTDLGSPPSPAGYAWWNNPIVRALDSDLSGTFYLLGQIRQAPRVYGLGFVRGQVTSPSSVLWDTPQVLMSFNNSSVAAYSYDDIGMEIDQNLGTIHVLCGGLNATIPQNALRLMRSEDGGTSWTPPAWIGVDSAATTFPLLQCGSFSNELYVLWSTGVGVAGHLTSRGIHSLDGGASFDPPFDIMQVPDRYQAGPAEVSGLEYQISSTIDRSGGPHVGRMIFGSTNVMDLTTDVFTDLSIAPRVVEAEPNGTAATANPVASHQSVIRGTLPSSTPADTDYFKITLSAGETIDANMDSTSNGIYLTLAWIASDGKTVLAAAYNSVPLGFRAPVAGNYYLRIHGSPLVSSAYRLRLTNSSAPLPGGRDQRDVMLALRDPSGPFTGGSVLTTPPNGYEETGVSLTWNLDGYVYASWMEFAVTAGKAISRRVIARSGDGGATWGAAVPLSSVDSDWSLFQSVFPGGGMRSEALSDGHNMLFSWTDGRNGDPDVFLRNVYRNFYSSDPYQSDVSAHPGAKVSFSRTLTNQDDLFPFELRIDGSSLDRNWPFTPGSASLAPAATAPVTYSFVVPDSAAQGQLQVFLDYRSDKAPNVYSSALIRLTVLGPADVEPTAPARLALERVAPNPARAPSSLDYSLSRPGHVRLSIYGIDGRRVRELVDGDEAAGSHTRVWDGANERGQTVAPGAYFVRMEAESRVLTRRFVWLR